MLALGGNSNIHDGHMTFALGSHDGSSRVGLVIDFRGQILYLSEQLRSCAPPGSLFLCIPFRHVHLIQYHFVRKQTLVVFLLEKFENLQSLRSIERRFLPVFRYDGHSIGRKINVNCRN